MAFAFDRESGTGFCPISIPRLIAILRKNMNRLNRKWLAGGMVLLGILGCGPGIPAQVGGGANQDNVEVQTPRREVEVNTGPGGANVSVNGNQPSTGKKVGVDVGPGGGVDVNVNGPAIREGIQERRAERTGQ
jgi:hypothetical protein